MVSQNKRREKDVMKLLVSQYEVHLPNESCTSEFIVKFNGPSDSPYEGVSISQAILCTFRNSPHVVVVTNVIFIEWFPPFSHLPTAN